MKCPLCGSRVAYQGLNSIECQNVNCSNGGRPAETLCWEREPGSVVFLNGLRQGQEAGTPGQPWTVLAIGKYERMLRSPSGAEGRVWHTVYFKYFTETKPE